MSKEPVSFELENFELEMLLASGWSVVRADEHPVAAHIIKHHRAVQHMLTGAEATAEYGGQRWRCRLTPKRWLAHGCAEVPAHDARKKTRARKVAL